MGTEVAKNGAVKEKATRQSRNKTVSLENLEALFVKKALDHYMGVIETQKEWPETNIFTKEDVLATLEDVMDKVMDLSYFETSKVASTKSTPKAKTATTN